MHPKIKQRIKLIKQAKIDKENEQATKYVLDKLDLEKKKFIESKIPQARLWVENTLFDIIAQAETSNCSYLLVSKGNLNIPDDIPIEAAIEAIKQFEGLKLNSHGHQDPLNNLYLYWK